MKIDREIFRLSWPAIVSNLTVPLLGLSDTVITGHLGNETYIGAIAVGSMLINAVCWLFGFLRMGTTGLTALSYGANDREGYNTTLCQSVLIGAIGGLLLILFRFPIFNILRMMMGASDDVGKLAELYFGICIWAAPAQLMTMCILGWFLGMQNTVRPMIISVGVNVLNIILSISLVLFGGLGFVGVAYGTLIAQWIGLVISVFLLLQFKKGEVFVPRIKQILNLKSLRRFFTVNVNIFFRSACVMTVTVSVTAIGARIGDLAVAANAVMMQFFMIFSYFMDGLAFTGEALAGRFAGAGNPNMLRISTNRLLMWAGVLAGVFFIIYAVFYKQIIGLITDVPEVVDYARGMGLWIILMPPLTVGAFIFDGFYIGLTATGRMLRTTIAATVVFFALALLTSKGIQLPSNPRLWTAFLTYLFCRGLFLSFLWRSTRGKAVKDKNA